MFYDPETANHLKPWLVKTLEPICDAEPGALADYILALLKHNAPEPELRREVAAQLDEFLEKESSSFIDTLFVALRTKSYLPYSATPSSSIYPPPNANSSVDGGIPIPLDGLLHPSSSSSSSSDRGRKRGLDEGDYDPHGSSKGARLNHDGQFSRYGGDGRSSWGGRGGGGGRMEIPGRPDYMDGGLASMDTGISRGMNGRGGQNYRPPDQRRSICRDYHNNGYCARGAYCKYSHGEDAVIPAQLFPMGGGGMPFMPMMSGGGGGGPFPMGPVAGAAYDPHERMDMRPMGGMGGGRPPNPRPAMMTRAEDGDGLAAQNPGELPVIQDLTPQVPLQDVSPHNAGEGFQQQQRMPMEGVVPTADMTDSTPLHFPLQNGHRTPQRSYHMNGRGGGGARGRGRGIFGGDAQSFRPERRNDKTLVVEKIPDEKLTLGAVNDWFSKFGTVTNVAVDAPSAKALVTFLNHEEAHKAWKSEEAVFGNRFVKVFWHRPLEGHGQAGQRMLAASAPIVAQRVAKDVPPAPSIASEGSPTPQTPTPAIASTSRAPSTSSSTAVALAAKQKLLEQQITEQKSLMELLPTASADEKKQLMARLRKLGEEMKPSASTSRSSPPAISASAPPKRSARATSTSRTEDHERIERERLDKELETHRTGSPGADEGEESTEELKAKLEKLKAEAASLGISDAPEPSYASSAYRPYRGRGRGGRGYYRGAMRGGPPRASMKLDNRPKKILVKGASMASLQAVRDWYETTGQVETVETMDGGDILVSFRSRGGAEQGFSKGSHIALVGPVQISWFAGQATGTLVQAPSAAPPRSSDIYKPGESDAPSTPADELEYMNMQEEAEPAGWGGDDDGFGMI